MHAIKRRWVFNIVIVLSLLKLYELMSRDGSFFVHLQKYNLSVSRLFAGVCFVILQFFRN